MHVCTAATRDHLAHARVLAEAVHEHHPGGRFSLLVVDDVDEDVGEGEPFELVRPADIGLERRELHRMAAMYTPGGVANACQSLLMRHFPGPLVQLDVDMCVYGPLDDIAALATECGVVLSPHTPVQVDSPRGREVERRLLGAGAYNAGMIATGPQARGFVEWMSARVRRDCIIDIPRGFHHRQRWLDLVPSLFPHHVLRDRGVNAMGWNLLDQDIARRGGGLEIDGAPLRLFHFCGRFDPHRPDRLSSLPDLPWPELHERPVTAALCADYAERLLSHGYDAAKAREYGFARLADGTPVDAVMRHAYRTALLQSEREALPEPPNPFEPEESHRFPAWLQEPVEGCPRYLLSLWRLREDLRAAFPDAPVGRVDAYLDWAAQPSEATGIPASLIHGRHGHA